MSHSIPTTFTITGSKARLARLGAEIGVAVTANVRDGSPHLVAPAVAGCSIIGAHLLPDGRVSGERLVDGRGEFFFSSITELVNEIRGWTPEKAEATMAAESHHRCERIRAEMAVNRKIAA